MTELARFDTALFDTALFDTALTAHARDERSQERA